MKESNNKTFKKYLENLKSIDIQNPNILFLMILYHGFINWLEENRMALRLH